VKGKKGVLAHRAVTGADLVVRVTPGARSVAVREAEDGLLHVSVTAPPADGAANAAVRAVLARALGVPQSRLTLLRGATARTKVWRVG
jgi:uncharacterized protein YggU (UPF0235/DUF167 family)